MYAMLVFYALLGIRLYLACTIFLLFTTTLSIMLYLLECDIIMYTHIQQHTGNRVGWTVFRSFFYGMVGIWQKVYNIIYLSQ